MFYNDLTPCSYSSDQTVLQSEGSLLHEQLPILLNVGWLDDLHQFAVEPASEQFLDALFELCLKQKMNQMRGFHVCQLCNVLPCSPMKLKRDGHNFVVYIPNHMTMERGGYNVWLGSAEIHVNGTNGVVYVAPDMIYHYVSVHNYLPPSEFVQAVCSSVG